jgi:hypothetical protein
MTDHDIFAALAQVRKGAVALTCATRTLVLQLEEDLRRLDACCGGEGAGARAAFIAVAVRHCPLLAVPVHVRPPANHISHWRTVFGVSSRAAEMVPVPQNSAAREKLATRVNVAPVRVWPRLPAKHMAT